MTAPVPPLGPDATPAEPPAEHNVVVSILGDIGHGVESVIEAVHDMLESPLDAAKEHMDNVTELQTEFISALSHGDVDGASALLAQANTELEAGVQALHGDEGKDAHPIDMMHMPGDA